MIIVKLNGKKEAIDIWGDKPVNAAMRNTLQRVAKSAVTLASAEIRNIYTIKKSDLDPRINLAIQGTDSATIVISGKGISLSYFNARQYAVNKTITRQRTKDGKGALLTKATKRSRTFQGVEVEVIKGQKTQLKSAFLAQMQSGHIGVMHRWANKKMKGKNKQAIGEKGVISVATMIQNAKVQPIVLRKVQEDWDKIFKQQLDYQLSKGKR